MKKFLDRVKKNNNGMSIVTVIVAIAFVAILVSIIMMSSVVNFKMKSVNVYAKDSFYSAEQVVDEINVGLQQMVSDGLSYAYTSVMTQYGVEDMTATDKNNMVRAAYYEYLWEHLGVSSGGSYDKTKYLVQDKTDPTKGLYGLLKESTKWHEAPGATEDEIYGAFLRSTGTSGDCYTGTLKTYEASGIVLKDLTVYYKDPNGFISAIKTDIKLGYPEFAFSGTDIPEIANYVFITDAAFVQQGSSGDTTEIKGNTYAYAMDVRGNTLDFKPMENDEDLHIVATDLALSKGGIKTNAASALWARDIEAKSSDVVLSGQTYVLDDLNITGRGCNIALKGYYTGFGNSTTNSKESSSILVNGADTTIDLSLTKKLTLAGRSYIGLSDTNGKISNKRYYCDKCRAWRDITADPDEEVIKCPVCGEAIANGDVYMGESIAVKSDQLMYLVPGECIGVVLDDDKKPLDSLYGKNPLTLTEYNTIAGRVNTDTKFVEVSGAKPLTKLGGTDSEGNTMNLAAFAKTDANGNPKVEKKFIRSADGSGTLVYYYMSFKDEESANTYFMKYYNLNKDAVDRYMSKYLKAITMPTTGVVSMKLDMAAIALDGNKNDGYEIADYVRVPEGGNTISESYEVSSLDYTHQYQAYCSKLTSDYDGVADSANSDRLRTVFPKYDAENKKMKTAEADSRNKKFDPDTHKYYDDNYYTVFKNLVDEEILKDMCGGHAGSIELNSSEGKVLLIYSENVDEVKPVSTSYDLIIANCGVSLSSSTFKGTIIAKGIIEVPANGGKFEFNADKVGSCLLNETDDQVYKVSDVFGDTDELNYTSAIKGSGKTVTAASLVTYENWTKNVNIN